MTNQLGMSLNWQTVDNLHDLSINDDELHLWWLPLSISEAQEKETHALLSQRQLDKYNRRSTPQLKHAYLAGRYYLFTLLAAYQNCKPSDLILSYGRLNKPHLNTRDPNGNPTSLQFNFTDTSINEQSFALYAFCRNKAVGVDLESTSRKGDVTRIAKRRFTDIELAYVTSKNGEVNPEKALAIWTRKEAYGKATGVGINFQMNQRNLIADSDITQNEYNFNDGLTDWRLLQIEPEPQFIASVVHETYAPLTIKAFKSMLSKPIELEHE